MAGHVTGPQFQPGFMPGFLLVRSANDPAHVMLSARVDAASP
jgi:hypothetical protein